jgi:hypothetical protein
MKRVLGLSSILLLSVACRDATLGTGMGDGSGADAGPSRLPDATVIGRVDAGPVDPEHPPPTLSNVTPASGPETGGTRVTLRGTSFVEPAEVFFGGVPATGVVVLDAVSIAATSPAGAIGVVAVEVRTPGGTAELPSAFRYHKDLRLDAVSPARIPEEGGVEITVRGRGFDDLTLVFVDRQPLRGARQVDAETIVGWAPATRPGRPEVWVVNPDAEARRSDLLWVYATPRIDALAPGYGPIGGGAEQELIGEGFQGAERVRFGTVDGRELDRAEDGARVAVTAPALAAAGHHDVSLENADASDTVQGLYLAYDPTRVGIELIGVVPNRASAAGGEVVTLVGYGLPADGVVSIGGRAAPSQRWISEHAVQATVPVGLTVGPQDVELRTAGSTLAAAGALRIYAPIVVDSIAPARGPASGGTAVTIEGSGFVPGVEVRIGDVPLADVVVEPNRITGRTVAGSHGPAHVTVESADTRGVLIEGFYFEEAFVVIRVDPEEGSIAGNTFVSIIGRGLSGTSSVTFGGEGAAELVHESGSIVAVRTAPARSGRVDVSVVSSDGDFTLRNGFTFYDPTIITGGAWGGPIRGSVNVAVLDIESGEPVPGMVVQLGHQADLRYAAVTDERGLATVSWPELRGAQTITTGRNGFEHATYMELDARNLTVFTSAHPADQNPDAPISPCPTGVPGPVVRGRVYKFKSSLDPVTRPGWRPMARCTYTDRSVFSPNPLRPASQVDFVFRDGGEFEITPQRVGTIAVYCILGDFNEETQAFIPRKMGIARQVPAAAETTTEDIAVSLDIDLDKSVVVRLDSPPPQLPGPTTVAVFPYLNLGSEGVIAFPAAQVQGTDTVTLTGLPQLAGSQFFYLGGSYTARPDGTLGAPQSVTLAESGDETEAGLDVGPFLQMPEDVLPKVGGVAEDGKLSWVTPGTVPDVTTVFVVDVKGVSGCCCRDDNMNGTCEDAEPVQCGGSGVQFIRWSIYGPGGLQSYDMPPMPAGIQAYEPPNGYFWVVQQAVAPRFDYREFIYNQFSPFFWQSWTVWFSQFVAKERTP